METDTSTQFCEFTLRVTEQELEDIFSCAKERGISPLQLVRLAIFDDLAR